MAMVVNSGDRMMYDGKNDKQIAEFVRTWDARLTGDVRKSRSDNTLTIKSDDGLFDLVLQEGDEIEAKLFGYLKKYHCFKIVSTKEEDSYEYGHF